MTWPKIVLIAWITLGAIVAIASVGKPRSELTPQFAAINTILAAGIIALVVIA